MGQASSPKKELGLELTNMKRNPYLVDYSQFQKKRRERDFAKAAARKKRARMLFYRRLAVVTAAFVVLIAAVILAVWALSKAGGTEASLGNAIDEFGEPKALWEEEIQDIQGISAEAFGRHPAWTEDFLTVNEYSRPGIPLEQINGIVIHYTANPGSTAQNNRDYFNGLKDSHETKVSSHFVVGIQGEIIQCIPSSEIAYASNSRNADTLSIECCHTDETGKFTEATYTSLVRLTGWLCYRFNLTSEDVIRHYDVTGKICPKYYVDHPEAWEQFKADVGVQIKIVEQEVLTSEGE